MQTHYIGSADLLKNFILSCISPPIPAGPPGPSETYREKRLDIFKKMVPHPEASYVCEAVGESMVGARIQSGDFLLVDSSVIPVIGKLVVATLEGGSTIKRLGLQGNRGILLPENPAFEPIPINEDEGIKVEGVVTWVFFQPS